jgi:anhydro-N-acetylmuramic acid kinase
MNKKLFIGVLSGTSMDNVDVAVVDFKVSPPKLLASLNYPIPTTYKERCLKISEQGRGDIDELGSLDSAFGKLFAEAVLTLLEKANLSATEIQAIGSHGQNLRHRPDLTPPFTLQIGDPNIIAELTGILTVADFRRRDIAVGGQGAPLAPGFHNDAFRTELVDRVIINIGGISNVTHLPKKLTAPIIGFDTGPGNCLMDIWIKEQLGKTYDQNGEYAATGKVNPALLEHFLADPYFSLIAPKSTGREYFNLAWINRHLKVATLNPADIQATLLALTARSIADALYHYTPPRSEIFVCGGGIHNTLLIETLSKIVKQTVQSTEALGIHPDWVEAALFAWLAKQRLEGKAGNCPSVTGARHSTLLGALF